MTDGRCLLRVAVPNKGVLAAASSDLLREAGYRQRRDTRDLVVVDNANGVEFFYLRPRDIAVYVAGGTLDVGLTGRDLVLDSRAGVEERQPLGFGRSRLHLAAPTGSGRTIESLQGSRIATSYAGVVEEFLKERAVSAHVIRLEGAVETAVRLGVADVVADVVDTGSTLQQAGLETFGEPILVSEAVLVTRAGGGDPDGYDTFSRRVRGVLVARGYVMMDYDIEAVSVEAACAITPGIESPTVSPLQRSGWFAVRAMVPRGDAHRVMDQLYDLGARGILVTDIHACRL